MSEQETHEHHSHAGVISFPENKDSDRTLAWDQLDGLDEVEIDELDPEFVGRVGDDRDGLHTVVGVHKERSDVVRATGYDGDFNALGYRYEDITPMVLDTRIIINDAIYMTHDRSRYEAKGNPIDDAIAASRCPDCDYRIVVDTERAQEKATRRRRQQHHGRTTERKTLWHGKDSRDWDVMVLHAQGCPRWERWEQDGDFPIPIVGPVWVDQALAKPGEFDGLCDGLGRTWDDPLDHDHVHHSGHVHHSSHEPGH